MAKQFAHKLNFYQLIRTFKKQTQMQPLSQDSSGQMDTNANLNLCSKILVKDFSKTK